MLGLLAIGILACAPGGALAAASPAGTVAGAQALAIGDAAAGGGGTIDFWKLSLHGGDQIVFNTSATKSGPAFAYHYELYAPEATDDGFAGLLPVDLVDGGGVTPKQLTLQAPYTGTFLLAVCEVQDNQGGVPDCGNAHLPGGAPPTGSVVHPMDAYTFTTTPAGVTDDQAASEHRAGATIAGAPTIQAGDFEAGGGGTIDFWKIPLRGGDQLVLNTHASRSGAGFAYHYEFYATDGMNDDTYTSLAPFDRLDTVGVTPKQVTLQAPYTGTFLLVVCEVNDANGGAPDCRGAHPPGGAPPSSGNVSRSMNPYTFTTALSGGITDAQAASEHRARPLLTAAPTISGGDFEAGGGEAIDFWKLSLRAGDQLVLNTHSAHSGAAYANHYELYPSGMTDDGFASTPPLATADTNGIAPKQLTLVAPSTGVFVLAVCQTNDGNGGLHDCRNAHPPGGEPPIGNVAHPMNPYTFSTSVVSAIDPTPTATVLVCSPASVTAGTPTTCVATVTDLAAGATTPPSGTVALSGAPGLSGCALTATGAPGAASCSGTFTPSAAGTTTITAAYDGNAQHAASTGHTTVSATAPPAPDPTPQPVVIAAPPPPIATVLPATLTIRSAATVRHGIANLSLSCSGAPGTSCAGTLTLTITVTSRHKAHGRIHTVTRTLTIGSASYRLAGGAGTTLAVKLTAAGRQRLAASHHGLKAKLRFAVRDGSRASGAVTLAGR